MIGYQNYCLQTPLVKRVPLENWLPLPYDNELDSGKNADEIQAMYEEARKQFDSVNWN